MSQYIDDYAEHCGKCGFLVLLSEDASEWKENLIHTRCMTVRERLIMESAYARMRFGAFDFHAQSYVQTFLTCPDADSEFEFYGFPPSTLEMEAA